MGNCNSQACPTHPNRNITKICLSQSCLQPLCDQCVAAHNRIHTKLGYPSQIHDYDGVKNQYLATQKSIIKNKQQGIAQQLAPTSLIIKNFTKQYFNKQGKNAKAAQILTNLQLWKQMSEDPQTNKKIAQFFRQNLQANRQIVGKNYQHLY